MAVLRPPAPVLRNEKDGVLDLQAAASDQFLFLSTECMVGWKVPAQSWLIH